MKLKLKTSVAMFSIVALVGAVLTSAPANAATSKTTLIVGMTADLDYLDPAATMDNAQWKITYPCYQRLVEYNGANTDVVAGLAKSWTISPDSLTYTFT